MMKVLIACEFSGTVRDAFLNKGHTACSCDLLDSENGGNHYKGNVIDILYDGWDLLIAHPPCTYLSRSGARWLNGTSGMGKAKGTLVGKKRLKAQKKAIKFFLLLANAPIDKICIENPVGVMSIEYKKPTQIIQPYEYGHNISKRTCLWLKNLPLLRPTKFIRPRVIQGKCRWGNQTDAGNPLEAQTKDRWKRKSKTYEGIAKAMANQWR